jgi:hypothetical protein
MAPRSITWTETGVAIYARGRRPSDDYIWNAATADWEAEVVASVADYTLQHDVFAVETPADSYRYQVTIPPWPAGDYELEWYRRVGTNPAMMDIYLFATALSWDGEAVPENAYTVLTVLCINNNLTNVYNNTVDLINRLGAWTGTGVNTMLGALRALANSAAGIVTPTDLSAGGTFTNTTDSAEALADKTGVGLTPQETRDAMKLAPTAGDPAALSIDKHLIDAATSLTTVLARLGAWTGTGVNTILGALRALANKAAGVATPTDLSTGGTFTNTTDSLEMVRDDAGVLYDTMGTVLDRLGAWTGTGVNTILGALRALANKAAGVVTPTDLTAGGGGFDNKTDSAEALRDGLAAATAAAILQTAGNKLKTNAAGQVEASNVTVLPATFEAGSGTYTFAGAANLAFDVPQNAETAVPGQVLDGAGDPVDLTDRTLVFRVVDSAGTEVLRLTEGAGIAVTDPDDGQIQIQISAADAADSGTFKYEFWADDLLLAKGAFVVRPTFGPGS